MRRSCLSRVVACSAFVLKFFVIVIIMGRKTRANTDEDINEADLSEEGRLIVLLLEQKIEKIVSKFTSEVKDRDAKISGKTVGCWKNSTRLTRTSEGIRLFFPVKTYPQHPTVRGDVTLCVVW